MPETLPPSPMDTPPSQWTEDQKLAFDRHYLAAKTTGSLDALRQQRAMDLDQRHNRTAL